HPRAPPPRPRPRPRLPHPPPPARKPPPRARPTHLIRGVVTYRVQRVQELGHSVADRLRGHLRQRQRLQHPRPGHHQRIRTELRHRDHHHRLPASNTLQLPHRRPPPTTTETPH